MSSWSFSDVGSPSQQLATTTAASPDRWAAAATEVIFLPVGNPAPPRPRSPAACSIPGSPLPVPVGAGPSRAR